MGRRATCIKELRRAHPELLLFDCGDFSQGTPYYNMYRGEVEVSMMNLMGYDAVAIGNHEFDFGLDNMARLFQMADFPVVCANYDVSGTVLEAYVKPYVVLLRGELRIGVFGLSPRLEGMVAATMYEGISYLDPVESAQRVTDILRVRERCDVVICLSHLGIRTGREEDDTVLAARTQGIDLILGGHTHTLMKEPEIYLNAAGRNVFVMHSGDDGTHLAHVKLALTKE